MNDLDRPLDDLVKEHRKPGVAGGGKKRNHARGNSVRSAPYEVKRRASANAVPTAPRGDTNATWKHDLYKSLNGKATKLGKSSERKEEVIQFPAKKLTAKEEAELLKGNPLFQRMNAPASATGLPPPKAPAAMTKSVSSPTIFAPSAPPSSTSISIAGTATAAVILSNLAPTVSVEDVKATLTGIGGGVRAVHIISQGKPGQGLQVKVTFAKPAEGGRECIAKFNGVVADGRKISVAFETPAVQNQETSFLNRRAAEPVATAPVPTGPRNSRQRQKNAASRTNASTGRLATPDGQLYSDAIVVNTARARK